MNSITALKTESADKLELCIPQNLYESLAFLAARHDRSINGEIKQAWLQWTDQLSDLKVMLALLTSQYGNESKAEVTRIDLRTPPGNIKYLPCKFKSGQVHQITEQANILMVSMNSVILKALTWWVNTWRQVDSLNAGAAGTPQTYPCW